MSLQTYPLVCYKQISMVNVSYNDVNRSDSLITMTLKADLENGVSSSQWGFLDLKILVYDDENLTHIQTLNTDIIEQTNSHGYTTIKNKTWEDDCNGYKWETNELDSTCTYSSNDYISTSIASYFNESCFHGLYQIQNQTILPLQRQFHVTENELWQISITMFDILKTNDSLYLNGVNLTNFQRELTTLFPQ